MAARLSEAVYAEDDHTDVYLQGPLIEARIKALLPDATSVTLACVGDTDFAVAITPDNTAIVIFRGTEIDAGDIASDLDVRKVSPAWLKKGKAASGFTRAFDAAKNRMLELIGDADNVALTGHSLGGAISLAAALFLKCQTDKGVVDVTTFCGPRLFDAEGAAYYDSLLGNVTTRVVDTLDIVPMLPLYTMGYRHTEDPLYLPYDGINRMSEGLPVKQRAFLFAKGVFAAMKVKNSQVIEAHTMSSVIKKLESLT